MSEATKQDPSTKARWGWVDRTIWTDRMLAALVTASKEGNRRQKWFSLIDKVYREGTLQASWTQVKTRKGAAGIDGVSVARFEAQSGKYLSELLQQLKSGSYRADPVRRVEIPKAGGKMRPLGIPTVKDRIVQTAVKRVIEPIFEQEFCDTSYGFRPQRGCKDALRAVDKLLKEGYTCVVDADLKGYFDSIPHDKLMQRVSERISDGAILALIAQWLRQDIVKELQRWTPTGGTPQGAVISPLLANLYLHSLDQQMQARGRRMVRYADDFVILCRSAEEAAQALEEVQAWVQDNGLSLNAEKTHVGDCRIRGEGFEFLGYRFEAGYRNVRPKSLQAFKDAIRTKTGRSRGDSLEKIVADLNPLLRGWYGYFKHCRPRTFAVLDQFVRRRLRAVLRKQQRRPGMGWTPQDHDRWSIAYFAATGLFTLYAARMQASQSRCGNH